MTRLIGGINILPLVCMWMLTSLFSAGQDTTHGTINIALANAQGLVAETDSMLSSNNIPQLPAGRKLYRADDHTVYMIAGFFSDRGPQFPSGEYPGATVIRSLMFRYLNNRIPSLTISQQLDDLSAFLGMELGLVSEMHRALQKDRSRFVAFSPSLITIAGYENGKPTIGHIEVVPCAT